MSTDAEKLAQIAALCDERAHRWAGLVGRDAAAFTVADLRAILAEPGPAVPPFPIDRDALGALLDREGDLYDVDLGPLGPKILALVRPVEGVTLTPEEAGVVLDVLHAHLGMQGGRLSDLSFPDKVQRLAARLGASS